MFKFKKFAGALALTVALAQVVTVVPVYANESEITKDSTCCHQGCSSFNAMDDGFACDNCQTGVPGEPVSNKDGVTHNESFTCDGCSDSYTYPVNCSFGEDGKSACICGQTKESNKCKHEKCNAETTWYAVCEDCSNGTYVYRNAVKVDDKYCNLIGTCKTCGTENAKVLENVEHWNFNDGYCMCGFYVGKSDCEDSVSGNNVPKEEQPKVEAPKVDVPTQAEIEEMRTEAIAKATEEVISREEAIPVTDFISTAAINSLPVEVKGATGDAAVYNLSKITTTQGFVAAINKIVESNKGANGKVEKAVTFYSATPIAFNAASLTALSDAATEFVYMFRHEGQLYKVTIPAGAKVDLEGQMFAGPLYIGAKLGTTAVVK